MAYRKEIKYPSIKTPGVYFDESDKKLGLDTDNLEELSLGNWTSYLRQDKIFSTNTATSLGKPILISFDREMLNRGIGRITYRKIGNAAPTEIKYRGQVWPAIDGDTSADGGGGTGVNEYGFYLENLDNFPRILPSHDDQQQALRFELIARHLDVWGNFFSRSTAEFDIIVPPSLQFEDYEYPSEAQMDQANYWKPYPPAENANNDGYQFSAANGNDLTGGADNIYRDSRNIVKAEAFIKQRNASGDSIQSGTYIQGSPIRIVFPDGSPLPSLIVERRFHLDNDLSNSDFDANRYPDHGGIDIGHSAGGGWTHEVFFPQFFRIFNTVGPNEHRFVGKVTGVPPLTPENNWEFTIGQRQIVRVDGTIIPVSMSDIGEEYATRNNSQPSDAYYWLAKLGMPTFKNNISITDEALINDIDLKSETFQIDSTNENGNDFIYHDFKESVFTETSFPAKVTLNLGLFDNPNFSNEIQQPNSDDELGNLFFIDQSVPQDLSNITGNFTLDNSHFTYQVIQWGDENRLLTNENIQKTYFFSLYDAPNEEQNANNYFYKKWTASQDAESKPIDQSVSHVYNLPGIKKIKIIIYRYDGTKQFLLQTYLVSKNIVINDGNLKSQDFQIFGGTDFTFLPTTENQAIIGGFDVDSKYNTSVEKIIKDDNFADDDFLQRSSTRDFLSKINDGVFGKKPGQLDLGQVRLFNQPRDLYDFIGGDKLQWIINGSGSLPVNSLATDIFIKDNNCSVDLNPSNSDFSVLQNQMGLKEIGILTGDYKLNQPKDSKVQKIGVMEISLLDDNIDKQAF